MIQCASFDSVKETGNERRDDRKEEEKIGS